MSDETGLSFAQVLRRPPGLIAGCMRLDENSEG